MFINGSSLGACRPDQRASETPKKPRELRFACAPPVNAAERGSRRLCQPLGDLPRLAAQQRQVAAFGHAGQIQPRAQLADPDFLLRVAFVAAHDQQQSAACREPLEHGPKGLRPSALQIDDRQVHERAIDVSQRGGRVGADARSPAAFVGRPARAFRRGGDRPTRSGTGTCWPPWLRG